ncbi:MAG: spondin domain-containing protein [Phycisphaerales bacterium]|nr:spondin domain-containing protein [Phycisphaerales bacterium]
MNVITKVAPVLGLIVAASGANAEAVSVTIENTMASDSFFFTPFWISAHNGSFDTYDSGASAADFAGLTQLAETGNTGPLSDAFSASAAGAAGGTQATVTASAFDGDAPVFSPGESTSFNLDVGDASVNRYFSFASMVIPSNDLFVANGNPVAYQLFDELGNFTGETVIEIYGRDVNDNGSEVNSAGNDAAFSTNDGQSLPEFGDIRDLFSNDADSGYLDSFIGSTTANGATIGSSFGAGDLIARITITQVPTPGTATLLMGSGLMMMRRRRSN